MNDECNDIKVVSVDREAIKMTLGKQIWGVPFKLSSIPSQDWMNKFYEVQHKDVNDMKRKIKIEEDIITVEIFEMDNLQKVLDAISHEVAQTNILCDGDFQKKLKVRHDFEVLQQRQGDATKKFQNDSDSLKF